QSQFMIVAIVPPNPSEVKNYLGNKICLIKFSNPHFKPEIIDGVNKIHSIGSGLHVEAYQSFIRERVALNIKDRMLNAEVMNPGGWGKQFTFGLSMAINNNP